MSNVKKYGIISLVILLVIGISYVTFMSFGSYSDGNRAGVLDKFSRKGVIFKTWEGELRVGSEDRIAPQKFIFSVNSSEEQTIKELENSSGKQIRVFYKEKYWVFPWQGESKYFIYKVEPVK
jgi:hypothetical protein